MKRKNYGKLGRTVAILVALLMVVSLAIPAFAQEQKSSDNQVVSMTEPKEIVFEAKMAEGTKVSDLKWFFGDNELNAWKKWSMETGDFTGGRTDPGDVVALRAAGGTQHARAGLPGNSGQQAGHHSRYGRPELR